MHSFHPSRGRIFFEVLLALGMSASLAGAWMQTQATALLGAAGVAALYGLIHLFDMRRPKLAETAEPQRIDFAPVISETVDVVVPMVTTEEPQLVDRAVEEEVAAEPAPSRSGSGRRTGGSRKGSGRRTKAAKAEKPAESLAAEDADVPWPMAEDPAAVEAEPAVEEPAMVDEEIAADEELVFRHDEEFSQPHIAPLFEPEPFARMPRRAFGRRGRL